MVSNYVPSRGDLVWLQFNPQSGHEQSGRRPALVLSPLEYNKKVGLAIFCPITSIKKGYPFEIEIPQSYPIEGVILSDQVKSLDWQSRNVMFICKIDDEICNEVMLNISMLLC